VKTILRDQVSGELVLHLLLLGDLGEEAIDAIRKRG